MNFLDERLPERFWDRVIPEPNTGCWIWTAHLNRDGYGKTNVAKEDKWRSISAHRLTYMTAFGSVPDGTELDHRCKTRCCVNPRHLEAVTHRENMRRGVLARRTHCPRGHEYSGDNVVVGRRRYGVARICKECQREAGRKFWREITPEERIQLKAYNRARYAARKAQKVGAA